VKGFGSSRRPRRIPANLRAIARACTACRLAKEFVIERLLPTSAYCKDVNQVAITAKCHFHRFRRTSGKKMSTSRVPRPRTSSSTPRGKTTPSQASPATPSRSTRGLAPPTLKTKISAPKLKPTQPASRAKSPISPSSDGRSSPTSSHGSMSIKEQIALRRAEQQKKALSVKSDKLLDNQSPMEVATPTESEDILGRLSIRDTIDRAKSSGASLHSI